MTHEVNLLFLASQQIAQAGNKEGIYQIAEQSLRQTPFIPAIYQASEPGFRRIAFDLGQPGESKPCPDWLPVSPKEMEALLAPAGPFLMIDLSKPTSLPVPIIQIIQQWGCETAVLIPVSAGEHLFALILLGSLQKDIFTPTTVLPYTSMAGVMSASLQKIQALERAEYNLAELRSLYTVSQAIAYQTNPDTLYQVIHHAVSQLIGGDISFLIALYDSETSQIQIPYVVEESRRMAVEPFPLGRGLTSILIRTRQPLLLGEDVERQALALGAILSGKPALSWLGVPIMIGGDVIGAIIVQDVEREHRFDEEDVRLLTTLASQVAIAIRNARLIETTRQVARRERLLHEVTSKIRSSVNMETILASAATEIGKALNASRTEIRIGIRDQGAERRSNGEDPDLDLLEGLDS